MTLINDQILLEQLQCKQEFTCKIFQISLNPVTRGLIVIQNRL